MKLNKASTFSMFASDIIRKNVISHPSAPIFWTNQIHYEKHLLKSIPLDKVYPEAYVTRILTNLWSTSWHFDRIPINFTIHTQQERSKEAEREKEIPKYRWEAWNQQRRHRNCRSWKSRKHEVGRRHHFWASKGRKLKRSEEKQRKKTKMVGGKRI